ncbi:solute carrier family 40 member 1-like [Rosa rugosa]|uniref:solute carrier family 40 member 1-like n=1 Tax=Rosa rugosa TaxID=74645 RepID=UPI002B40F306|nr:solute carrier family 40 member 1-like [Rosa rugosa]
MKQQLTELLVARLQEQPSIPQSDPVPSFHITYLYVGHFLARWGTRMWDFSVGIYGAVESASTALFGPIIGHWVDRFPYVKVLRIWLLTQNLSFVIAGGTVLALLVYADLRLTNFFAFVFLIILTNISGAVGVLSTLAGTILVERDWAVVISEGHSPEVLTKINSVMRRIDLFCKLCAPVLTGLIMSRPEF